MFLSCISADLEFPEFLPFYKFHSLFKGNCNYSYLVFFLRSSNTDVPLSFGFDIYIFFFCFEKSQLSN